MKVWTSILAFALSVSAWAMPKVGDMALYKMEVHAATAHKMATLKMQLVQFDSAQDSFLMKVETSVPGHPTDVRQAWVNSKLIMKDDRMDQIMLGCVQLGGVLEGVVLPFGTVPACRLTTTETLVTTNTWMGKMPFGLLKSEAFDSAKMTHTMITMVGYAVGN